MHLAWPADAGSLADRCEVLQQGKLWIVTCLIAGHGMYSYLPRVLELPEWGGLKAADSVFTLFMTLAAGPKGTYCRPVDALFDIAHYQ